MVTEVLINNRMAHRVIGVLYSSLLVSLEFLCPNK